MDLHLFQGKLLPTLLWRQRNRTIDFKSPLQFFRHYQKSFPVFQQTNNKFLFANNDFETTTLDQKPFEILRSVPFYQSIIEKDDVLKKRKPLFSIFNSFIDHTTHSIIVSRKYRYDENFHRIPCIGSIVETRSKDNQINFAVVTNIPTGIFDNQRSRIGVYTITGESKSISISDITFHMYRFFNPKKIQKILLTNIPSDLTNLRRSLLYYIRAAIHLTELLEFEKADSVVHSKISKNNYLDATTVDNYLDELPLLSNNLYFDRRNSTILKENKYSRTLSYFAAYLNLTNTPNHYIFKHNYGNNLDYNEKDTFSSLIPNAIFLVNSSYNSLMINNILNYKTINKKGGITKKDLNTFIQEVNELLNQQYSTETNKFYKWINGSLFVTKEECDSYETIINLFKYYLLNPHEQLKEFVTEIFRKFKSELFPKENINRTTIYEFLKYFGILNDESDILLSNNIINSHSSIDGLKIKSISSVDQVSKSSKILNFSKTYNYSEDLQIHYDNFSHIRRLRSTPVYGLFPKSINSKLNSEIAISVDKINNSDDELKINFHIPDIASFIYPRSKLFKRLFNNPESLKLPNGEIEFIPESVKSNFGFQDSEKSKDEFSCLTFSFNYKPWSIKKFNLENNKIQVSLEKLSNINIIENDSLIHAITDEGIFESLNFMKVHHKKNLSKTDKQNLSSVYVACLRYSGLRNVNSSLECSINEEKPTIKVSEDGQKIELLNNNNDDKMLNFFRKELNLLVNDLASRFSICQKIPIIYHSQTLIEEVEEINDEHESDYAIIKSPNFLIPDYRAFNYNDLTFRKVYGLVSPQAYFLAMNYFNKPSAEFEAKINIKKFNSNKDFRKLSNDKFGLTYGQVTVNSPFNNLESIINHWQIIMKINNLNMKSLKNQSLIRFLKTQNLLQERFFFFKTAEEVKYFHTKLNSRHIVINELKKFSKKFWTLRYIEKKLKKEKFSFMVFKCVITHSGKLPTAYCLDLGIFVEIDPGFLDHKLMVGDQVICSKVNYLNVIEGQVVLGM